MAVGLQIWKSSGVIASRRRLLFIERIVHENFTLFPHPDRRGGGERRDTMSSESEKYESYSRGGFTVISKSSKYDANHLTVSRGTDGWDILSFICSGQLMTIKLSDVEHIEFHQDGIGWCGECDARLDLMRERKNGA